jgi:uncharacterized protein (TIGR03437 family)
MASAIIGGTIASVLYAGTQGDYAGLDQANISLPRSLAGRGAVDLTLSADGNNSNAVSINFK